jgi:cation:H+ antiporter
MLIKGADVFVESASGIAKKFGIPSIIIGLTIVAMGTSAPELSVSVQSALAGMNDISIGNVVGSNLFNLLVVLGVSSIVGKLKINNYRDVIIMLLVGLILTMFAINGTLIRTEGLTLLVIFAFYIGHLIFKAINNNEQNNEVKETTKPLTMTIILGIIGLVAIVWGGNLVVDSASIIAQQLGMSQNLIGLTIVAIGTSLPELVTSVVATKKGELDIAVGNVIGSNIFNLLLIIGLSVFINPMVVSVFALYDLIFMIFAMIIFIICTFKKEEVIKKVGIPMIIMYVVYIIFTIIR